MTMAIYILLIIAFWMLPLPVAVQVLMTIFGSIGALASFVKGVKKIRDAVGKN